MDVYSDQELDKLAQSLADKASQSNFMLATAESCTGGWLAKLLTDISGSSAWFERGFVTYSNQAKNEMLGVSLTTLDSAGAVSQQTAEAMAKGALLHSHAQFSVAITGIAGPSGGTIDKPVGLVWFAWASFTQQDKKLINIESDSQQFIGDRSTVRRLSVAYALHGLLKLI